MGKRNHFPSKNAKKQKNHNVSFDGERDNVPNTVSFFSLLFYFCLKRAMCQRVFGFVLNFEKMGEEFAWSIWRRPLSTIIIIIHFNFVLLLELGI